MWTWFTWITLRESNLLHLRVPHVGRVIKTCLPLMWLEINWKKARGWCIIALYREAGNDGWLSSKIHLLWWFYHCTKIQVMVFTWKSEKPNFIKTSMGLLPEEQLYQQTWRLASENRIPTVFYHGTWTQLRK